MAKINPKDFVHRIKNHNSYVQDPQVDPDSQCHCGLLSYDCCQCEVSEAEADEIKAEAVTPAGYDCIIANSKPLASITLDLMWWGNV